MKTFTLYFLRPCLVLALWIGSLGFSSAADQTITGNFTVEGDSDFQGNTLSVGTRADSTTTPGINWIYSDGPIPSVFFNATRGAANWLWQDEAGNIQLKLDKNNRLTLYDQSAPQIARVLLDPSGTSSFLGPVLFSGSSNEAPNQTLVSGGSLITAALGDARYRLGGSTINGSVGGLVLNAGGANQNISLVPSGAGQVSVAFATLPSAALESAQSGLSIINNGTPLASQPYQGGISVYAPNMNALNLSQLSAFRFGYNSNYRNGGSLYFTYNGENSIKNSVGIDVNGSMVFNSRYRITET